MAELEGARVTVDEWVERELQNAPEPTREQLDLIVRCLSERPAETR